MLDELKDLARLTFSAPRAGGRAVLNWRAGQTGLWELAALLVLLSVILSQLSALMIAPNGGGVLDMMLASPFLNASAQGGIFVVSVHASHRIGRAFGGTGTLDGALRVMIWLQAINVAIQMVQLVALILMPPVSALLGIASVLIFFWLYTNFIAELHGFTSLARVFAGVAISFIAIVVCLSLLLGLVTTLSPGGA